MVDMVRDHKKVDGYLMQAQWDTPGQMANWQNGRNLKEKLKIADMAKDHKKID